MVILKQKKVRNDIMKCFSILDVLKTLTTKTYSFNDDTSINFNSNDFINYLRWKCNELPYYDDNELKFYDAEHSFNLLWSTFNENTRDSFSRIKDALGLEYEVLDNYNGMTESTTTDTFNNIDSLGFINRSDTTTLNNSDTLSFTDRNDTRTLNTSTNETSDANNPKTTTTRINEHKSTTHYTSGYNSDSAVFEYEDVTKSDALDEHGEPLNDSEIIESGTMTTSDSGTITDAKAGSETTAHSGTITDAKTGKEETTHTGTIKHEFEETKHGNLGVTTSQQMLESEVELRLKYKLRPLIVKAFLDEYFYL